MDTGMQVSYEISRSVPTLAESDTRPALSVVLPTYNEADAVADTVQSLIAVLEASPLSFEVIVVDDGSTDASHERVRAIDDERIMLVQHPYNIGNGAAVKTGVRRARGRLVALMDADGQHRPDDLARLLAHASRYDMVVGARTRESDSARHRDLANCIFNLFASYVCGIRILDLTSGFRVIRADVVRRFLYLLPNRFSYPTTITLATVRAGHSVTFVPVQTRRRVGRSKIRPVRDAARFFTIIFKIAVLFSPLKVFVPISAAFFGTGLVWYLYRVFVHHTRFPPISTLLFVTSLIVFMIGLLSEQITYLRHQHD